MYYYNAVNDWHASVYAYAYVFVKHLVTELDLVHLDNQDYTPS